MKRIKTILFAIVFLGAIFPASAQRTAKGERFLRLSADYIPSNAYGAELAFGLYTMNGFWDFAAETSHYDYTIVAEETFLYEPATSLSGTARAGYMHRLLCNRSRRLNLYAGGGMLLGLGTFETSSDGWTQINKSNVSGRTEWSGNMTLFRYGLYPKIEFEAFAIDNLAIDVAVKCPLYFAQPTYSVLQKLCGVLHCELSAGVKYNF